LTQKLKLHFPSPSQYNICSTFYPSKQKGFSFGLPRASLVKQYLKSHPPRDPAIPGPGSYKLADIVGGSNSKYSIKSKASPYKSLDVSPGPAKYNKDPTLNSFGNYFNSKYKNSLASKFNPICDQRFFPISNNNS